MRGLLVLAASLALGCATAHAADSVVVKVKDGGTECQLDGQQLRCDSLSGQLEQTLKTGLIIVTPESCGELAMNGAKTVAGALEKSGFTSVFVVGFLEEPGKTCDTPAGYEWYLFEEGKTACLRPKGWFVKTEVKGDTAAMFFTKEDIDKEGEFKKGFTLNVLSRIQEKTGRPPSQYARDYLDALLAKYPEAKRFEEEPVDGAKVLSAAYLHDGKPAMFVTRLLADDQSDVLRILILESPRREWLETWALGERTLDCKIRQ